MTVTEAEAALRLPENAEEFRNLWDSAQEGREERYNMRSLAQRINPAMTEADFDRQWQWCNITSENYDVAVAEFVQLVAMTF
jgi:hypothetical protein